MLILPRIRTAWLWGGMVMYWLAPSLHRKKVLGLNLGLFSADFPLCQCGFFYPRYSHSPKIMQIRLTGYSTLPINVNVRVNVCSFFCVSFEMDWQPADGVPHLLPEVSCNGLQLCRDPGR